MSPHWLTNLVHGSAVHYDLTIAVPVYNESVSLPFVLAKLEKLPIRNFEIVLVDDGSSDGSSQLLRAWQQQANRGFPVHIVHHQKNAGKGAAIQSALEVSQGKYFVVQDADLEYEPAQIPKLINYALRTGAPVVYGSRFKGKITGMAPQNYIANRVYNWLLRRFYNTKVSDMHTCYKMIRLDVLKSLELQSNGFNYAAELVSKLLRRGIPIAELPIHYDGRTFSEGKKINARDGLECLFDILGYRFLGEQSMATSKTREAKT